jgi:hypothetical protein
MPAPTTLAVVDGNPVAARALKLLLEGAGYEIRSLTYPFNGNLGEALAGAGLLLLPPALGADASATLLASIGAIPALVTLPVVALVAPGDEPPRSAGLAGHLPWPCRIEVLVRHIEAVFDNL